MAGKSLDVEPVFFHYLFKYFCMFFFWCNYVLFRFSNLLANSFNCNCHLAWLGKWLRKKRIVSGNPRCLKPFFLKDIPIQDVDTQDFTCEGKKVQSNLVSVVMLTLRQHLPAYQATIHGEHFCLMMMKTAFYSWRSLFPISLLSFLLSTFCISTTLT